MDVLSHIENTQNLTNHYLPEHALAVGLAYFRLQTLEYSCFSFTSSFILEESFVLPTKIMQKC